uniref:Uncharacterized protein n=1 Tax=Callorhinchus milii TaxID=7868 RepID=A0A4W3H2I6_CALMI
GRREDPQPSSLSAGHLTSPRWPKPPPASPATDTRLAGPWGSRQGAERGARPRGEAPGGERGRPGTQVLEANFNPKKAVQQQLRRSSVTRQCLGERVAEGRHRRDRSNRPLRPETLVVLLPPVPPPRTPPPPSLPIFGSRPEDLPLRPTVLSPHPETGTQAPDLMMFHNVTELVTETPYLGVQGLSALTIQSQARPSASVFTLYQKLKQWEA